MKGKRVGDLLVISPTKHRFHRGVIWKTICTRCGRITLASQNQLWQKKKVSCGCSRKSTAVDITGELFGHVLAVRRTDLRSGSNFIWECYCELCNSFFITSANSLVRKKTRSCGCQKTPDLSGQQFGELKVSGITYLRRQGAVLWKCHCACGRVVFVETSTLVSGRTRSCGCLRNIEQIKPGTIYGGVIAVGQTNLRDPHKCIIWDCKCTKCGSNFIISSYRLRNGLRSCGCEKSPNLIGREFGDLLVIANTYRKRNGKSMWACRCICGAVIETQVDQLTMGKRNCGDRRKHPRLRRKPVEPPKTKKEIN